MTADKHLTHPQITETIANRKANFITMNLLVTTVFRSWTSVSAARWGRSWDPLLWPPAPGQLSHAAPGSGFPGILYEAYHHRYVYLQDVIALSEITLKNLSKMAHIWWTTLHCRKLFGLRTYISLICIFRINWPVLTWCLQANWH